MLFLTGKTAKICDFFEITCFLPEKLLKFVISAKKSLRISAKTFFFFGAKICDFGQKKPSDIGQKKAFSFATLILILPPRSRKAGDATAFQYSRTNSKVKSYFNVLLMEDSFSPQNFYLLFISILTQI